jgi:MFS family permease
MSVAYMDRVNLSVAIPDISKMLHLNPTEQGFALSAFFVTYALLQVPFGWLVDRFGVRTPYVCAFLLWSAASVSLGFTGSLLWLIAMRLLLGVGEAVVMPASLRYIRMHFDESRRGMPIGVLVAGTKIGPAVGFPIAAYMAVAFGWRAMFVLTGLVPLLWLSPYLRWVTKDDIAAQPRERQRRLATDSEPVEIRAIFSSPMMWGTIIGTFCYNYFFYYCMTWMPVYVRERFGMSLTEVGWYAGISFAGMAGMAVVGGYAADRLIARGCDAVAVRKSFTILGLGLASTLAFAIISKSSSVVLFFSAFSLCGLGLATANYWAVTQTLIPGGAVGTVVGIQNTAGSLGGIAAPVLTGWLIMKTGSFDAPLKVIGFWLALGIVSYAFLVRKKYVPLAASAPNVRPIELA